MINIDEEVVIGEHRKNEAQYNLNKLNTNLII
jgi:hypothetical protein